MPNAFARVSCRTSIIVSNTRRCMSARCSTMLERAICEQCACACVCGVGGRVCTHTCASVCVSASIGSTKKSLRSVQNLRALCGTNRGPVTLCPTKPRLKKQAGDTILETDMRLAAAHDSLYLQRVLEVLDRIRMLRLCHHVGHLSRMRCVLLAAHRCAPDKGQLLHTCVVWLETYAISTVYAAFSWLRTAA